MIHHILVISAYTKTALHIGANHQPEDVSDSLFRRNAASELILPGTGIAGAIRGHLTRLVPALTALPDKIVCDALLFPAPQSDSACGCVICRLMGDIRPLNTFIKSSNKQERIHKNGGVSRLIVHDGRVDLASSRTQIRDGVGIDRVTGTSSAASNAKFDLEILPAGTRISITLEVEDSTESDEHLIDLILSEWQEGRLRFGGNSSRGLGVLGIDAVQETKLDLSTPVGLMHRLRRDYTFQKRQITAPSRKGMGVYQNVDGSLQSWLRIDFTLNAQGFLLTNDITAAVSEGYNHYAMTSLPGSGLRGVIRHQAEKIARTLTNLAANDEASFLEHCPAADPLIGYRQSRGLSSADSRIREMVTLESRKQWSVANFLAHFDLSDHLFGNTFMGSRLSVEDGILCGPAEYKTLDFVAINRFTGGAKDRAKFNAAALWKPVFDCRIYLESPKAWEIGCLLHVLKDLQRGRLNVGFGSAKGFGEVIAENIQLTVGYAYPQVFAEIIPPSISSADMHLHFLTDATTITAIGADHWLFPCLAAFKLRVANFSVNKAVAHTVGTDPYWGTRWGDLTLNNLYPKGVSASDYQ